MSGEPAPDSGSSPPPPPRPRSSLPMLAACTGLLLLPVAGLALKRLSPDFWRRYISGDTTLAVSAMTPTLAAPPIPPPAPSAAAAPAQSSLGFIRGAVYDPPSEAALPEPARNGTAAAAIKGDTAAEASPTRAPAPRRYPKLNPTRGWAYTNVRTGQDPGVTRPPPEPDPAPLAVKPPAEEPKPNASAKPAAAPARPPSASASGPPKKFRASGGGGRGNAGAVQYGGAVRAPTSVGPAGPVGVMEHGPLATTLPVPEASPPRPLYGPPDARPAPNPEVPEFADGPCPKRGWWKNEGTKVCYYTKHSCLAGDHNRSACGQPNP